jgi:hypothetical protein
LQQGAGSILGGLRDIQNANISYIILAISAAFEGNALGVAFVLFKQTIEARGEKVTARMLLEEFKESKDLTVLVEDSAALLGTGSQHSEYFCHR